MSYSMIQRLRGEGVTVSLLPDGKTAVMSGPGASMGGRIRRQHFFNFYGTAILAELLLERATGARIAEKILSGPIEPCVHNWGLLPGPGLQPISCTICGATE